MPAMTPTDAQHAYLEALAVDAWAERWLLDLAEDLHRRIERGKAWQEQQRQKLLTGQSKYAYNSKP